MGIPDHFGGGEIRRNIQKKVEDAKRKALNEKSRRNLEMKYLGPDEIRKYTGKNIVEDPIKKLIILLAFPNKDDVIKFRKHFKVADYITPSVTNIQKLLAIVDELEAGRIIYEKGKIRYSEGSHEMGTGKPRFIRKKRRLSKSKSQ